MLPIVRLFVVAAVLVIVGYASMIALTRFVEPEPRDYLVSVSQSRFNR